VFRGARKGRGLVVSPKDYSTKYRYWCQNNNFMWSKFVVNVYCAIIFDEVFFISILIYNNSIKNQYILHVHV
jgi:hypothetical protein